MIVRHAPARLEGEPLWADMHAPIDELLEGIAGPAWYGDAACREHPELCWVDPGSSGPRVIATKAVCAACLVRHECLTYALADPTVVGIWGGTTTRERRALHGSPRPSPVRRETPPAMTAAATGSTQNRVHIRRLPRARSPEPKEKEEHDKEEPLPMPRNNHRDRHGVEPTPRGEQNRAARAVLRYLDSLSNKAPAPKRSTRTVEAELAKLDERLADPDLSSGRRLELLQSRRNLLTHGLSPRGRPPTGADLLDGFIAHGATYARTHAISYETFVDFGVPAEVLDKAEIHPQTDPTSRPNRSITVTPQH